MSEQNEPNKRPSRRKKARELKTDEAMRRLFPKAVRDAAKKAAGIEPKRHGPKAS